MNLDLKISEQAALETHESYLWYQERQEGLGEKFLNALDELYVAINNRPESFPIYTDNFRRALLGKFPFLIFYKIYQDRIVVFSVFHASREPDSWREGD